MIVQIIKSKNNFLQFHFSKIFMNNFQIYRIKNFKIYLLFSFSSFLSFNFNYIFVSSLSPFFFLVIFKYMAYGIRIETLEWRKKMMMMMMRKVNN